MLRFRFTLSHAESGLNVEISEPDGWRDCTLKLDRHEEFHSLIEFFDGSFIFYGNNGQVNGGLSIIKNLVSLYGPDTTIEISIDFTHDEVSFTEVFNGQLSVIDAEEMPDNKMRIPIIRDDFWSKFIARQDIPIDIQSTTNLEDEVISPTESIMLDLPSQKIRYVGSYEWTDSVTYADELNKHGLQLDWEKAIIDDLKKFTLPRLPYDIGNISGQAVNLIGNFEAPYDGDYTFDITVEAAILSGPNWVDTSGQLNFWVQNPAQINQTDFFTVTDVVYGSDSVSVYTFNKTIRLKRGDQLAIYGQRTSTSTEVTIFGTRRFNWVDADLATTTVITLSGEQSIDGTLTSSSVVLVKNQGNKSENGVYTTSAGAWTRIAGADTAAELLDLAVYVSGGTDNINTAWRQDETAIVLGTSDIVFTYIIPSDERLKAYPGTDADNHLIITADTTYIDTDAQGFLLHDVFAAVSDRIIGIENTFWSSLFGSEFTLKRQYEENGCAWTYALTKGLQIRQYALTEKPFTTSFGQLWKGANPIFNLSLCYEGELIRIEEKQYQYDDSEGTSADFYNIRNITRKYDNERIFNKVEIGYAKWEAEDISGIDDPQTKKTYSARFQKIGKAIQIFSEWIGASLAIEATRRKSREKSTDYKFDNDVFIIALNPDFEDSDSPDTLIFVPELDENFSSITDLLNPDTRYNIRITPARNFLRWRNFLQGALQPYLGSFFKFASGEGNYDMASEMDEVVCLNEDYDGEELSEKENIPVTNDYLHLPDLYEATLPMEWSDYQTIRDNKRKPIGISLTDSDPVPMFIKTLSYKPVKGEATVLMWAKEYLDLSVVEDTTPTQECYVAPDFDPCEDALTDELGEILTDELGVCLTD